jgi:hypothetical protein
LFCFASFLSTIFPTAISKVKTTTPIRCKSPGAEISGPLNFYAAIFLGLQTPFGLI